MSELELIEQAMFNVTKNMSESFKEYEYATKYAIDLLRVEIRKLRRRNTSSKY